MTDRLGKALTDFEKLGLLSKDVDSSKVIDFLDVIAKELNLLQVYVCESTGANTHFIYPFVSSKGPYSGVMFHNLIVFREDDIDKLVDLFSNGVNVFDGNVSSSSRGTAQGNLAYGYVVDHNCVGFVSFQPKEGEENRIWTDEEKELITRVAILLKPLVIQRQINDRFAYEKNLSKTSIGIFWYYPTLKLIIVPEATMERFDIKNFVYRDAPKSFSIDIASEEFHGQIDQAFESINRDNTSTFITFSSKKDKNQFYHVTLSTDRFDNDHNPVEIMGMIERIGIEQKEFEEKTDILKRYEAFKKTISDNNRAEYYVNLLSGKVTLFKVDDFFRECFEETKDFDSWIKMISTKYVCEESRPSFEATLNTAELREKLSKHNHSISLVSNFNINGETRILETSVVMNSTSIYDYTKDVMVFVRDITHTESRNYDRLTGLLTMSHLLSKMKDSLALASEEGKEDHGTLIYYDFGQFKFFNLQYGVLEGDTVLKKFAEILRKEYPEALLSRFSDDHFVVLDTSVDSRVSAIRKVEEVISSSKSLSKENNFEVFAGIHYPDVKDEPAISVDYAQLACQDIKRDKTHSYKEYDEQLKIKNEKRKYIIEHIDDAISNQWIKVFYQPVVSTSDLSLAAMEALARWVDPVYGFLSPADFIPALEENNLIYKLDMYIIDSICHRLRNEIDKGNKVVPISFNLSRNDFLSCRPFEETEKCVQKYNLDRKLLSVEITESVTMDEPGPIHKAVDQFREAGYEVWMDDFGSGYSSLNVLKDFYFDEIKIDMAFLRTFNEKSRTIVTYVIQMAKNLKIRTLTEGVETKEHVDFLTKVGCERIQGYYFSKPLPYEELMKTLKEKNILIK